MKYKPKYTSVITPTPYFKIAFECGNMQFYAIKGELNSIADKLKIDIQDGYISEHCDFEGDLEEIRIYNDDRGKDLINEILDFYGVKEKLSDDMMLVLSLW